jgi:hypothetical protein
VSVSYGGSSDTTFGPLCFDLTVQHICRTTVDKIITFYKFLCERQHTGNTGHRRIPEEEQLCCFELSFRLAFVPYAKQVLQDFTKNHHDKKCVN